MNLIWLIETPRGKLTDKTRQDKTLYIFVDHANNAQKWTRSPVCAPSVMELALTYFSEKD